MFSTFLRRSCRAEQATEDNIAHAPYMLYHLGYKNTLGMFNPLNAELNPICHLLALLGGTTIVVDSRLRVNIYCFPTATVVARSRLHVSLYVHCLSC